MNRALVISSLIGALVFAWLAYTYAPVLALFADSGRQWHAYYIPSESMLPTLEVGDRIYPRNVDPSGLKRGMVVLFRTEDGEVRIARIAAIGGDTIAMRDGHIVLNGKPVAQTAAGDGPVMKDGSRAHVLVEQLPGEAGPHRVLDTGVTPGDDTDPTTLADGEYFLLGDNRDNAADSRYPTSAFGVGVVPAARIFGMVDKIAWSTAGRKLGQPIDRLPAPRQ